MGDHETADSIYQRLLEKIDSSLLENGFQKCLSCVDFPRILKAFDGTISIATKDELVVIYNKTRRSSKLDGVPGLTRHCLGTEFKASEQ